MPRAQPKPRRPRVTVNLDTLDGPSRRWRITLGRQKDPLPRAVATDPGFQAAVSAWMTAHASKTPPSPAQTDELENAIKAQVLAALEAMPPETR